MNKYPVATAQEDDDNEWTRNFLCNSIHFVSPESDDPEVNKKNADFNNKLKDSFANALLALHNNGRRVR